MGGLLYEGNRRKRTQDEFSSAPDATTHYHRLGKPSRSCVESWLWARGEREPRKRGWILTSMRVRWPWMQMEYLCGLTR